MKRRKTFLIELAILLLILVIYLIYWVIHRSLTQVGWWWLGFSGYTDPTSVYHPPKTLWDILDLLIVPAALALTALWFSRQERKDDRKAADRRADVDFDISVEQIQETALQTYFDRMEELLLKEHLSEASEESEVRIIARARTLATLRILDPNRKGALVRFLYEAMLIRVRTPIISMEGADLNGVILDRFDLRNVNLRDADLFNSQLWLANLSYADLFSVNFSQAYLSEVDLSYADLRESSMYEAHLSEAKLIYANLCKADLTRADLNGANLTGANLSCVNLAGADLNGADLTGVDLSEVNLSEAKITCEQLFDVKSLEGAIMPDGQKYNPIIHKLPKRDSSIPLCSNLNP